MPARPPGRRTESLFDNRYRYDYIYPRGRSGETLRAYDIQQNDRPVVIKRPAPQDAPPMRAGQEISIRNEKQALERLSGHPVLTELCGGGTFRVGGHTHEYIVMELAQGEIVEDMILELAEQGEYLSELETLVIVDRLLDLLATAHDKRIIYNDVDAKHLFWDREAYQLKVIDWGNAVFTDEPGALPTVTRATDVYQCGELLYFILTGGNRLVTEVEGSEAFFVNFGPDAARIPARLQTILTRAVHPDPKRRYATINELRHDLAEYRSPLERDRDEIIARVNRRVRATASKEELEELRGSLQAALDTDPGHPETTALAAQIDFHLKQISIQADLDAIRIYLESGNWARALSLLNGLLPDADPVNESLIRFLMASAATLEDEQISSPPAGFLDALASLFDGNPATAGQILLTTPETRPAAREVQWLLAERLATLIPDVTLLRPHLVRLRHALKEMPETGPVLALLDETEARLDSTPLPGLNGLQVVYQQAATTLSQVEEKLESLSADCSMEEGEACLASVIRAQRVAHDVIHRLDEVGRYAFSDPSRAGELLHEAMMVDPTSLHFEGLNDYFDEIHQAVTALGQFKPRSDAGNLSTWFVDVKSFLQPYLDDLSDKKLRSAFNALNRAAEGWTTVVNYLALGRRQPTIDMLHETAEIIRPFNEHIAAWLGTRATQLPDAPFAERYSPNDALADLLIDGWKAWDQSKGLHAAELGRQAHEQATTDGERLAAGRLRRLGELLDNWVAQDGSQSAEYTDRSETEALAILLAEEEQERKIFAEQMPNTGLYLRAMGRGIIAYMRQSSSAGWRALYMHYVLRGALAVLSDNLEEAEFWRSAAGKVFEDAPAHRAYQALDRHLTGRRLLLDAENAFNAVSGPDDLDAVQQALNAPLAPDVLPDAAQAVQALSVALRDWSDGEFHSALQRLNTALEHIDHTVKAAEVHIEPFVTWLTDLRDAAEDLHQARLTLEQGALSTSEEPNPALTEAHAQIVQVTLDKLGSDHAHQVRQWQDMYRAVLETYTTQRLTRREKMAAFSRHFASLFITKHPVYPLFRHWEELVEQWPADETEDDVIDIDTPEEISDTQGLAYLEDDIEPEAEPIARREPAGESDLPWNWIIMGAVLVLIVAIGLAFWRYSNRDSMSEDESEPRPAAVSQPSVTPASPTAVTKTPETPQQTRSPAATVAAVAAAPTETPVSPPPVSPTPVTATAAPPTPEPPTPIPPTPVSSAYTPSPTPVSPTRTPGEVPVESTLPTITPPPPDPTIQSETDIMSALANLPNTDRAWPDGAITPGDDGTWILSTANTPDDVLNIELSPEILSTLFGPGAANSLLRVTAVLKLIDFDEAALAAGEVSFGLGAKKLDGERVFSQVMFVESSAESSYVVLGLTQFDQFGARTEGPQPNSQVKLSMAHKNNVLQFRSDDNKYLGDSVAVFPPNEAVIPVLYVSGKGVRVEVSLFEMQFSPRDELP